MGEVYRARDTRLDRDVAIKVSAKEFSERFTREARSIARRTTRTSAISTTSGPSREEIFVRPFAGPGGKWKISTNGGKFPAWSRKTQDLFFLGDDDRIMVVNYTVTGNALSPGRPRVGRRLKSAGAFLNLATKAVQGHSDQWRRSSRRPDQQSCKTR